MRCLVLWQRQRMLQPGQHVHSRVAPPSTVYNHLSVCLGRPVLLVLIPAQFARSSGVGIYCSVFTVQRLYWRRPREYSTKCSSDRTDKVLQIPRNREVGLFHSKYRTTSRYSLAEWSHDKRRIITYQKWNRRNGLSQCSRTGTDFDRPIRT